MKISPIGLPGMRLVELDVFGDERGAFMELWSERRYRDDVPATFVQDNVSRSRRGVLRGLHFQSPGAQGKLVSVLKGEIFDVVVDVRPEAPTFGQWTAVVLSDDNARQLWVPEGLAHGFLVMSDDAIVSYKCTAPYDPRSERTLVWNDPAVGVEWPHAEMPLLSPKDAAGLSLAALFPERAGRP